MLFNTPRTRSVRSRRGFKVGMAVALSVALMSVTACGSSPGSDAGASGGATAGTVDIAAAKAAIAPYVGQPSAFPVNEPFSQSVKKGMKFVYLQADTPVAALSGALLEPAIETLGATMTVVKAGSTATSSQAAASSALALKPDAVLLTGIEPAVFGGALKKLSDAGIVVVSISISEDVKPFGITFNFMGANVNVLRGQLLADWVIVNKGADADVVFYGVPELAFSQGMETAFGKEMKAKCSSCTVRVAQIGLATVGTTAPNTIVNDLQSHPQTNVAVFASAEAAAGLPPAMKVAGISGVDTLGFAPTPGILQQIKDGGITAGLAVDFPVSMWASVDAAARLVAGDEPTASQVAGDVPMQFLEKDDITFDPSKGWTGYPDFAQRFTTLWATGAK